MEKIGHGFARGGQHFIGAAAGEERAAGVGIGVQKIALDGVCDLHGDLCSGGTIEESGGLPIDLELEGGKLRANPGEIESWRSSGVKTVCGHGRFSLKINWSVAASFSQTRGCVLA